MKSLTLLILATISTTSYSCFKCLWCCCFKGMQEEMDRQERHDDQRWQQQQAEHKRTFDADVQQRRNAQQQIIAVLDGMGTK